MHPAREQKRKDYMSMNPNQLRRKIFQMQTFIEGQFAGGSYDSQDMYDTDLGHLSTLVDMIDAYNANSPDNKMDYPKIRDETMRPVQYGSYQVVQEKVVKITKRQLRRIIKEERQKLAEMDFSQRQVDRAAGVYTPIAKADTVENSIVKLWGEIFDNAVTDEIDEDEAAEMASLVLVQRLARALDSLGERVMANQLEAILK